ncbi:type II secretion system major pseudopilin GspG [Magnetospira sp. QH-2]|uniref:type II secretion system major pseudopilin GspG n=1 Tax=Magnetospira sp. (strain QH-2) TaxID=1288970 RepID=UPI0003E816FB|nr:type II secretion system major pseudopilin GspG [Magnetospira sp. QH-2]CCQ73349.1 Pseudopilin, cryptic, general secretion pathway [Magnetospira sp. QH-2]
MMRKLETRKKTRLNDDGFTLMELLVVLVILGLLAGLAGPRVLNYLASAKSDTAAVQIARLSSAVDLFLLDVGRPPNGEEGLQALVKQPAGLGRWNGPYLAKAALPADPWGNAYRYRLEEGGRYVIVSLGADNAEGGEDENRDIAN